MPTPTPLRPLPTRASPSRALRVAGATLLALLLASGAWLLPERTAELEARGAEEEALSAEILERRAIAAHLERVERALRAAPADHLDEGRRTARMALLDELAAYREAGVFPRNVKVPGRAPVFVDDEGTHCAVGHLLHATGEDGIVASIRGSRNLALLPELLDEPGLPEWLDAHGLDAAEAAWIQPMYCNMTDPDLGHLSTWCPWPVNVSERELRRSYLLTSVGTGWIGGTLAAVNLLDLHEDRPSAGRALVGMAAGAAGVGLGLAGILEGGDERTVGWMNLAVGAFGVGTAAVTFRRASSGPDLRADRETRSVVIRPWIPIVPGDEGSRGAGVQVRVTR